MDSRNRISDVRHSSGRLSRQTSDKNQYTNIELAIDDHNVPSCVKKLTIFAADTL